MKTICIAGKNDIAVDVLRYCMDHYPGFRILCITNRTETGVNSWQRSFQFFAQHPDLHTRGCVRYRGSYFPFRRI